MTDYTDLKARLGRVATLYGYCTDDTISANTSQAATEALAAIEALEAEVARLRNAAVEARARSVYARAALTASG